jgi:hypothetical protein
MSEVDDLTCVVCGEHTGRKVSVKGYNVSLCRGCEGESIRFVYDKVAEDNRYGLGDSDE